MQPEVWQRGHRMKGLANIEYHLSQPESDRLRLVLHIADRSDSNLKLRLPHGRSPPPPPASRNCTRRLACLLLPDAPSVWASRAVIPLRPHVAQFCVRKRPLRRYKWWRKALRRSGGALPPPPSFLNNAPMNSAEELLSAFKSRNLSY